jgi:hypothetical protein
MSSHEREVLTMLCDAGAYWRGNESIAFSVSPVARFGCVRPLPVIAEPGETISPIFAADSICESSRCRDESVAILGRNGVDCSRLGESGNSNRRSAPVSDLFFPN